MVENCELSNVAPLSTRKVKGFPLTGVIISSNLLKSIWGQTKADLSEESHQHSEFIVFLYLGYSFGSLSPIGIVSLPNKEDIIAAYSYT